MFADRACRPNPCKNGATCSETDDGKDFKCVCLPWHAGRLCEGKFIILHFYRVEDLICKLAFIMAI